ncbi:MAG: DUF2442 domain-containing protein [Candidatus Electrothrix sp. AUS3]|nr:DUF2442 domain-containing protein [Candidatus Electrothrix gigas]
MKYPKVRSVKATDNHILIVEFDNNEKKQYDVTPLLEKEMFSPLKNTALFKSVRVEQGGWAVSWNDKIDLSEFELWKHGKAVDEHHESDRQKLVNHFSQKAIDEADKIWEEKKMTAQTMDDWLQ